MKCHDPEEANVVICDIVPILAKAYRIFSTSLEKNIVHQGRCSNTKKMCRKPKEYLLVPLEQHTCFILSRISNMAINIDFWIL